MKGPREGAVLGGLFPPVLLGLIGLAWATLFLWEASPYGRYLDHGSWTEIGLAATLCSALPQGEVLLPALLYSGGWLLMSAAMMLPTTLPLLAVFRRLVSGRAEARLLVALVIGGYLVAWWGFGLAAHALDGALHLLVRGSTWLPFNGWAIGAAVLAVAGAFQFSSLKHHCLTRCRTPFSFVASRWHGRAPRWEALRLGLAHGVFCVGCCWALMLLMFVVGTGGGPSAGMRHHSRAQELIWPSDPGRRRIPAGTRAADPDRCGAAGPQGYCRRMSPPLPAVNARQAVAALQRAGFVVERVRGSHDILARPDDPTRAVRGIRLPPPLSGRRLTLRPPCPLLYP
jgi:predicted metal-binding membrane protein